MSRKEIDMSDVILKKQIPLYILEYLDYPKEEFYKIDFTKDILPDSKNKLVYADNDICYYDCQDGDFVYIDTNILLEKYKTDFFKDSEGNILIDGLSSNDINVDCDGTKIFEIAYKYMNFDSIKENCYIDENFKKYNSNFFEYEKEKSIDLFYVKDCRDYLILKDYFNLKQLKHIDNVLTDFINYEKKYDDGEIDIIGEYTSKYGNSNIIAWYEGLDDTKTFIEKYFEDKNISL